MNNPNLLSDCCHEAVAYVFDYGQDKEITICTTCLFECETIDTSEPDNMTPSELAEIKEENAEYFAAQAEFNNNLLPIK